LFLELLLQRGGVGAQAAGARGHFGKQRFLSRRRRLQVPHRRLRAQRAALRPAAQHVARELRAGGK
jgi:hypothetical protein